MKKPNERGFAILIILAVIATTSVVLATQLASVENQQMTAIRAGEELKARDVAEGCLSAADAYVQDFGLADTGRDFDALLDPDDSLATTVDNLLPPADLLANPLGTATIPPGVNDQFHHFRVFRVTGVGACFVRFDDNSDDSNTLVALDRFTDAGEGTGVDLPQRDRDRSMSVTVVGVVPDRANIADLYPKAHAVASITVLRAMPPAIAQGAAIEAGGTADLDGAVCGSQAGLVADSIKGGACVCGTLDAQLISGSQGPCAGCTPCAATAGSTTGPGARPDPDVVIPPFSGYLSNESFGEPGSTGNNIGDTNICKLFFRDDDTPTAGFPGGAGSGDAQVFLWDSFDNNAQTSLNAKFGAAAVGVAADDCTNLTSDPVPAPCNWSLSAGGVPNGVNCAAGKSGCWKLISHLRDGAGVADFDPGAAAIPEMSSAAGDDFAARAAIPNIANTAKTWANYCGGCTGCAGPTNTIKEVNAPAAFQVGNLTSANFPSPAILVFETNAADAATDGALFGGGTPDVAVDMGTAASAKITILANGGVKVTANSKYCCATCDCPTIGAVSGGACSPESANVIALDASGFALRTQGNCAFGGKAVGIVGRIDCMTFDSDNGDCFIGDIVSHQPEEGPFDCDLPGTPAAAFCTTSAGICFKNTANVRGSLFAHSNICTKNNLAVTGSIQSESNIGWKNNGAINGRVLAEEDVGAKNNNDIIFNGTGGTSAAQGIAASLWIDGMW